MGKRLTYTKLERYYGFTESVNSMLLSESILKTDIHPGDWQPGVAFLKVSGRPSNQEYLLILNLFNAFLKGGSTPRTLLDFRISKLRKPVNSSVQLFEAFDSVKLNNFRLLNFMYMLLVVYVPRIFGTSDRSASFITSAIFPDFNICPEKLDRYTRVYPQYGTLLKKTGFSRFILPADLLAIIPFSSYMLKHLYTSSIFEDDWTIRIEFCWLASQTQATARTSLLYSFFKLCNF